MAVVLSIVLFFLLAILGIAAAVYGMVAVGIEGRHRDRHPGIAHRLARAAQAMNGDGQPPRAFGRLLQH